MESTGKHYFPVSGLNIQYSNTLTPLKSLKIQKKVKKRSLFVRRKFRSAAWYVAEGRRLKSEGVNVVVLDNPFFSISMER